MATVARKQLPKVLADMTKKLKAYVYVNHGSTCELFGTCWDEGSKSDYTLVNLKSGEKRRCAGASNPWVKPPTVTIEPGWVLVCTGVCQGKPASLSVRIAVEGLDAQTPVGIVADWLDDGDRYEEAALLRLAK